MLQRPKRGGGRRRGLDHLPEAPGDEQEEVDVVGEFAVHIIRDWLQSHGMESTLSAFDQELRGHQQTPEEEERGTTGVRQQSFAPAPVPLSSAHQTPMDIAAADRGTTTTVVVPPACPGLHAWMELSRVLDLPRLIQLNRAEELQNQYASCLEVLLQHFSKASVRQAALLSPAVVTSCPLPALSLSLFDSEQAPAPEPLPRGGGGVSLSLQSASGENEATSTKMTPFSGRENAAADPTTQKPKQQGPGLPLPLDTTAADDDADAAAHQQQRRSPPKVAVAETLSSPPPPLRYEDKRGRASSPAESPSWPTSKGSSSKKGRVPSRGTQIVNRTLGAEANRRRKLQLVRQLDHAKSLSSLNSKSSSSWIPDHVRRRMIERQLEQVLVTKRATDTLAMYENERSKLSAMDEFRRDKQRELYNQQRAVACALCEKVFLRANLPFQTSYKAIMDLRRSWNLRHAIPHDPKLSRAPRCYHPVNVCRFCKQLFNDEDMYRPDPVRLRRDNEQRRAAERLALQATEENNAWDPLKWTYDIDEEAARQREMKRARATPSTKWDLLGRKCPPIVKQLQRGQAHPKKLSKAEWDLVFAAASPPNKANHRSEGAK